MMNAMQTTELPDVGRLYVDSVDTTAVERDWLTGYGETWDFIEAPECPECGAYGRWISGDNLADLLTEDAAEGMAEGSTDETWEAWRCPTPTCEHFGADLDDIADRPEGPMMNYSYALPSKSFGDAGGYDRTDAEKIADLPLCIVTFEDTGEQALALTGGGMDLSWEIAEAFMRLGHLPPLRYCDLPRMAGKEMNARNRWIVAGCLRSCDVAARHAASLAAHLRAFSA